MQGVVKRVTLCLEQEGPAPSASDASAVTSAETARQRLEQKRRKFSEGRCLSTPHPITLRGDKPRPATHPSAASQQQRQNGAATIISPDGNHLDNNSNNITFTTTTVSAADDDNTDSSTSCSRLAGISSASSSSAFSSSSSSDLTAAAATTTTTTSSPPSTVSSKEGGGGGGGEPGGGVSTYQLTSARASQSRGGWGGRGRLAHAHSMPDNLDKLTRKRHFFSMLSSDSHSVVNRHVSLEAGEDDIDSSDDSEYSYSMSGGYGREKCRSARSSHLMLAALDQMLEEENLTYAEALWDHVTMDPEELGFRAGDLIRVTDCQDKHWWFGVLDDTEGWFPAAFVRLLVNQDLKESELDFLLSAGGLSLASDTSNLMSSSGGGSSNFQSNGGVLSRDGGQVEGTLLQCQKVSGVSALPGSSGGYLDNHQARANVVNEIISAEREYVKHLRDVVEGYVKQARKRPEMFPIEKVTVIFSNIEEIYAFATELLAELEESLDSEQPYLSQLGRCFLGSIKSFEMYSDYCNNHPAACEELRELYRNKRYRHFFEACRLLQEMIEIPLEGFLLTPVQKICKYHLQLAELLKFTPPSHPDHCGTRDALEAMKRIATLINERKRKMESVEKLAAWQLLVDDWEGPDILESSSELIYSGELNKVNHAGWSQERYFFLFDHQLIYCKKDLLKKSGFGYKGRIYMDACQVLSIPDGRDSQYNVSVRHAWKLHDSKRDKWYLLVAKTEVAKQRWLKAFQDERRRVKEDAENNFNIPSHVKEAVITSFKQKANLNKPKGRTRFNRTNSSQSFASYHSDVNAIATLPRNKNRLKVKVKPDDEVVGKGGGKKINWFFLGKGKS